MSARDTLWRDHQRTRWSRPDARRWIRPDAGRFLKPGVAIASAFSTVEAKYSAGQPRVPAGSSEGGQWSSGGSGDGGDIAFDAADFDLDDLLDFDRLFEGLSDFFDLSSILSFLDGDSDGGAGDFTFGVGGDPGASVVSDASAPILVSDTNGKSEDPDPLPNIPTQRPDNSSDRTSVLKELGRWFGRNVGKAAGAAGAIDGLAEQFDYIGKDAESIKSYGDPPKNLEELQDAVSSPRNGYQKHHIDEQALARRRGMSESQINSRDNLVLIPTLKHFDINGYYSRSNPDLGGLSPRQYLEDKSLEERMQFGLDALVRFKVLKP